MNQMPGIAAVDALEVPRTRDDFRVGFSRTRSRLQQDVRFHIYLSTAKNLPFFRQRIGRDPHAVLQVAETFVAQVTCYPFANKSLTSTASIPAARMACMPKSVSS